MVSTSQKNYDTYPNHTQYTFSFLLLAFSVAFLLLLTAVRLSIATSLPSDALLHACFEKIMKYCCAQSRSMNKWACRCNLCKLTKARTERNVHATHKHVHVLFQSADISNNCIVCNAARPYIVEIAPCHVSGCSSIVFTGLTAIQLLSVCFVAVNGAQMK